MDLFKQYPVDLPTADCEIYEKALRDFEQQVYVGEDDECWLPRKGLENSARSYFFGYKDAQRAALILNGPIHNTNRRSLKIVCLCPHEDCCNPDHMYLVSKRNMLIDSLREMFGEDDESWRKMREHIGRYEQIRENRTQEALLRISTPGLPPNTINAASRELKLLTDQKDWAFNNAIFDMLGRDGAASKKDKFYNYLASQGLLTSYGTLPKIWKDVIHQLLECPYDGQEIKYYIRILQFVAYSARNTKLRDQLRSLGIGGIDIEDYTI